MLGGLLPLYLLRGSSYTNVLILMLCVGVRLRAQAPPFDYVLAAEARAPHLPMYCRWEYM